MCNAANHRSQTPSRPVTSDQHGVHRDLRARVARHRHTQYRRPIHSASAAAFECAQRWLAQREPRPLILDAGCGTGMSSQWLAQNHPEAWVIGVDKSASRLQRTGGVHHDNLLLVQANLLDLYPLALQAGWRCAQQTHFYPNPWPKAAQLNKRWHGSPVFPMLVRLGGALELRSNWRVYVDEMQLALQLYGVESHVTEWVPVSPVSRFEAKYAASGHALWCLKARLD
ncbi:MAG: methyltransferase domain-containing protein [Pseudomonadota bacterium]